MLDADHPAKRVPFARRSTSRCCLREPAVDSDGREHGNTTTATAIADLRSGAGLACDSRDSISFQLVYFSAFKYWNKHVFCRYFDFGFAGVEFFFVLSGFITALLIGQISASRHA